MEYVDGVRIDVMVDVETTGFDPAKNAILELSAIPFYPYPESMDIYSTFQMNMPIPYGREWDLGTKRWHEENDTRAYRKWVRGELSNPYDVIGAFLTWWDLKIHRYIDGEQKQIKAYFWAKNPHFDYRFVKSYIDLYGFFDPIKHNRVVDQHAFCAGIMFPHEYVVPDLPWYGDPHNSLHDCEHQVAQIEHVIRNYTQVTVDPTLPEKDI